MSRRRSSFDRAYADGVLGNIVYSIYNSANSKYITPLPTNLFDDVHTSTTDYVSKSVDLRKQQALVDILIRSSTSSKRICAPHLLEDYQTIVPRTTAFLQRHRHHMNILTKHRMSLAESLYYALTQCSPEEYHGVLLPYGIHIADDDADHANMIYLYFDTTTTQQTVHVHCYLLEPNGASFTKKHPSGLANLTRAWHYLCSHANERANQHLGMKLIRKVRIVGEEIDREYGLQTYLGSYHKQTTRRGSRLNTTLMRSGYDICGAVTFWLFHMWLKSSKECTLDKYYKKLLRFVKENRAESQHKIMKFIRSINAKVKAQYASITQTSIDTDLAVIQKHVQKQYGEVLKAHGCTITVSFTIKLGNEQTWLLEMKRRVCVGC